MTVAKLGIRGWLFSMLCVALPIAAMLAALVVVPIAVGLFGALQCERIGRQRGMAILRSIVADKTTLAIIACLLAWPLLSFLWSIDPRCGVEAWYSCAAFSLLGIITWKMPTRGLLSTPALVAMAVATIVVACGYLLQTLPHTTGGLERLVTMGGGKGFQFIHQAVYRGVNLFAVFIWPLAYGLQRRGKPMLALLTLILMGLGIELMDSMSAQLGFACGLVTYLMVLLLPQRGSALIAYAVPPLFLAAPFLIDWAMQQPFFTSHAAQINAMGSGRVEIWSDLYAHAHGYFWIGHGVKTARLLFTMVPPPMHPHNQPLELVLELGLVGYGLIAVGLALLLHRLRQHPARAAMLATVVAFIATGFSSCSVWQYWWFLLPFLCLLLWKHILLAPPGGTR